jgi:hypothetical protein
VRAILANPRYTGRQVWNRQRTDQDLIDPANTTLGHQRVQRWNLPEGWVISNRPAHTALVSEADYIAAQNIDTIRSRRDTSGRRYLLSGLLRCGLCDRRMESCWVNQRAAYRCHHGHTSATPIGPGRPRNAYIREDRVLPYLPALGARLPLRLPEATARRRAPTTKVDAAQQVIKRLRALSATLTYDPGAGTLQTDTADPVAVLIEKPATSPLIDALPQARHHIGQARAM